MKLLFICNLGKHRSKTAAELFSDQYETDYAGIYEMLSNTKLQWADVIVTMEDVQRKFIAEKFPAQHLQKKVLTLNISDVYDYNSPN